MEQPGEIGQRVQMLLELALRHEECITKLTGFSESPSLAQ